ncbi:MAG: single-stranded DNA-binding protein [Methylococcaceae bacterium]|nr:single-stranded DNA-binding protein [Methylococcaceae bacterium]
MNKLIITGRLTRDAEVRYIPSGTAVLSFSVANNTGYGKNEKTHFFNCSLFGKRAEGRLQEFMKKGKQVIFEGGGFFKYFSEKRW